MIFATRSPWLAFLSITRWVEAWARMFPPAGRVGSPKNAWGFAWTWFVTTTARLRAWAIRSSLWRWLFRRCWRSLRDSRPMYSPLKWERMESTTRSLIFSSWQILNAWSTVMIWWVLLCCCEVCLDCFAGCSVYFECYAVFEACFIDEFSDGGYCEVGDRVVACFSELVGGYGSNAVQVLDVDYCFCQ